MKISYLLSAMVLFGSSGTAQAEERSFEEAAELVIVSIGEGRDLAELDVFHTNYEHEAERLARLKGCEYKLLPESTRYALHLDWICPDPADSAFTRIYISDGELSRIEFQPVVSQMAPSAKALDAESLPSPADINEQFVEAVKDGADPTLGGLIPISDDYLAKLSEFAGWHVKNVESGAPSIIETRWMNRRNSPNEGAMTWIHFDEAGRPIGVWIRTSAIRAVRVSGR